MQQEVGVQTNVGVWEKELYLYGEYDAKFLYDRTRKKKNKIYDQNENEKIWRLGIEKRTRKGQEVVGELGRGKETKTREKLE